MFYVVLLLAVIGGIAWWLMGIYNNLQAMMQDIREQLSNLQAALKKRTDLTAQIVDIAKSYGDHEKIVHLSVSQGNQALTNMQALSQEYPQLRANETYQSLMGKLENLENLILDRRERYNAMVNRYNSYRNRFPAVMIAQKLSFGIAPYYEMEDPDFMDKVKVFERDDSEALQRLVDTSTKALGHKMQDAQTLLKQKIDEGQEVIKHKATEIQEKRQQNKETTAVLPADADSTLNNDKA